MVENGKEMTIPWHVDNLKTSHVDAYEVTKLMDWTKGIYGIRMKEFRRKRHDYLRMDLDLSVDGEVRVIMMDYLKNIVSEFTDTIQGKVLTPAEDHLFTVS